MRINLNDELSTKIKNIADKTDVKIIDFIEGALAMIVFEAEDILLKENSINEDKPKK